MYLLKLVGIPAVSLLLLHAWLLRKSRKPSVMWWSVLSCNPILLFLLCRRCCCGCGCCFSSRFVHCDDLLLQLFQGALLSPFRPLSLPSPCSLPLFTVAPPSSVTLFLCARNPAASVTLSLFRCCCCCSSGSPRLGVEELS